MYDGVTRLSGGDIKQFTHSIFLVVHTLQNLGFYVVCVIVIMGLCPLCQGTMQVLHCLAV